MDGRLVASMEERAMRCRWIPMNLSVIRFLILAVGSSVWGSNKLLMSFAYLFVLILFPCCSTTNIVLDYLRKYYYSNKQSLAFL